MGKHNSTNTRVAPIFDQLLAADPTGAAWLSNLITLGSRASELSVEETGLRLLDGHGRRWGSDECALAAPLTLLEHLVTTITPEQVVRNADPEPVQNRRMALARRDAIETAAALTQLRAGRRGRDWFVLEGESRPDALLETPRTVVVIAGKRTERSCTSKTKWMGRRSQLIRHVDAAIEAYPGKQVLGMLVVEGLRGAEAMVPRETRCSVVRCEMR